MADWTQLSFQTQNKTFAYIPLCSVSLSLQQTNICKSLNTYDIYKLWENESFTESFLSVCVSLLKILMTRMIHLSLLCMTWEYIFLKNAMWEEVHQQLITSATFFKIKAALPTYFLFFMFSFSIAELDHLICGFCG